MRLPDVVLCIGGQDPEIRISTSIACHVSSHTALERVASAVALTLIGTRVSLYEPVPSEGRTLLLGEIVVSDETRGACIGWLLRERAAYMSGVQS